MKPSQRLQPVVKLKQLKEDEAVRAFAASRQRLANEEQKLQQLSQYYDEYQQMVARESGQGLQVQRLTSYHHFMQRLSTVVTQQQQQVQLAQQDLAQKQTLWLQQRGAHKSMATLVEKHRDKERLVELKKEQKNIDEIAQQLFLRQARNRV